MRTVLPGSPTMSVLALCPNCRNELPANAPLGLCPLCLLGQGMDGRSLILSDSGEPGTAADSIHDLPRGNVLDTLRAQVGEIPRVLLPETEDEDQSRTGEPSDGPA